MQLSARTSQPQQVSSSSSSSSKQTKQIKRESNRIAAILIMKNSRKSQIIENKMQRGEMQRDRGNYCRVELYIL